MRRIGIIPASRGAGAGLVTAMVSTELAAISGSHGKTGILPGRITAVELGCGNLFDQLCADRWFRVRQMVSYWNCVHNGGQVERIINPRCGVNWLLRTPEDRIGFDDVNETTGGNVREYEAAGRNMREPQMTARGNLERGRAVKLLYSLPGDVAFVDFSSVNEADILYLLEDMDHLVAVVDPLPSKLIEGYERIYRLKLCKKPVLWVVNRWTEQINARELKKVLGNDRSWIALPEIPRGLLYQEEYEGCGVVEHPKIRQMMAPAMEEIIRRLRL